MPIFHHKKTHGRFFFIHIPRTAGRFLTQNFFENGYDIEHHLTKKIFKEEKELHNYLWTLTEGVELSHTHRSLYSKWESIKGLSSIAVVRNPVDRFFSVSGRERERLQSSFENWTICKNILSKGRIPHSSNWWRPQHEFVYPHTKIWKYENGFGKNFCDWINNILLINFSIKSPYYHKNDYEQPKLIKTKPLIDNIKKFYHQDFEKFGY